LGIAIGVGVGLPLVLGLLILIIIVTEQRKKLRENDENPEPSHYTPSLYEDPVNTVRDMTYANIEEKKPTDSYIYATVASEFSLQDNYERVGDQRKENYSNLQEMFGSDQNTVPHFIRRSPRDTMFGDIRF